uniref:Uncharacterized protein n=1 Tax=Timema bartmani TaxID=61472 RepID=A0A7R9F6L5_9NEOP|nr:unnamed protein product [Timema bartmani]
MTPSQETTETRKLEPTPGKELKIKPGTAKDTREKLRRCFMNALSRRRNKKSGDGATKMPPLKFEQ